MYSHTTGCKWLMAPTFVGPDECNNFVPTEFTVSLILIYLEFTSLYECLALRASKF